MSETTTIPVGIEVPGPAFVRRPYGLFSVVPAPTPDPHALAGVWWRTTGCGSIGTTETSCITYLDNNPGVAAEKVAAQLCNVSFGRPVTVYALGEQSTGGTVEPEVIEATRALLTNGEEFAVEQALWTQLDADVATMATATSPLEGLALLEAGARKAFGGTPVLHVTPYTATLLGDQLVQSGQRLTTRLGTLVVVGGGYDSGETWDAAPASQDMFITGPVVMWSDAIQTFPAYVHRDVNLYSVLAERTYVLGWDCLALGATITPA